MILTPEDKETLILLGAKEEDLPLMEKTIKKTIYKTEKGKKIKRNDLLSRMDRETWLSGICRSFYYAFSMRYTESGQVIFFDASKVIDIPAC